MRTPTAVEFLDAWERGFDAGQVARGLELLAIARPDVAREQLADLSIGARDAALLSLREAAFGPDMTALVRCPSCGESNELHFTTADLRVETPPGPPLTLQHGGREVQLRLLTSRDLAAAEAANDLDERRRILLARCVVSAHGDASGQLPAAVAEAAVARVAAADAQADVQLGVSCAECGHAWRAPFDIVSFLWTELTAWAERTLREVHVLASHYGWTEREILALSPLRRRHYLGMVRAWPIS
jgi:hypothetical protein